MAFVHNGLTYNLANARGICGISAKKNCGISIIIFPTFGSLWMFMVVQILHSLIFRTCVIPRKLKKNARTLDLQQKLFF